jgi:DNA-binding CsgD family transcriptional regulator
LIAGGAMPDGLRRTGVNVLGDLAWGSHVCLFYESKQDLLDVLLPYIATGLESGEAVVLVASEPLSVEDAHAALRDSIPALNRYLESGAIEIVPGEEWYLNGDQIDTERVLRGWQDKLQRALDRGFKGLRLSGNALRLGKPFFKIFGGYESALHAALPSKPTIALCTYSLSDSSGSDVFEVARSHGVTIARRNGVWEFIAALDNKVPPTALTRREREVLTWIARGKTALEIGGILLIAKRTVDEHTHSAMRKLGAANRTQAVAIALRSRLIDL